jgi:hypothetical protein
MSIQNGPKIATNGLLLTLDAANVKSYPGSGTTWTDLSRNGNNGTLTNGPTFNSNNRGSIVFDGVNDYVDTGPNYQLQRPFSINSWVYFNSLSGWQTVSSIDGEVIFELAAFYWGKTTDSGSIQPRLNNTFGLTLVNSSGLEVYTYDNATSVAGVWYNYSVSVNTDKIVLYKNGLPITTTTNSDVMEATTGNLLVGAGYFAENIVDYVNGRIAYTSLYNRALSTDEVAQNFYALRGRFVI